VIDNIDNNDYGESSPFLRETPYIPYDTLKFDARYQWKKQLFVPDHEYYYVIGRDVPEKLARVLMSEGIARPGRTIWENQEDFHYEVDCVPRIQKIYVPERTPTDFYSVPRLLWWKYPPTGIGRKAAHVHDVLCQKRFPVQYIDDHGEACECVHPVSSKEAAWIFREAMEVALVPPRERWWKYQGVRSWFGPRFEASTV